jgi:rhamnosyltransferase
MLRYAPDHLGQYDYCVFLDNSFHDADHPAAYSEARITWALRNTVPCPGFAENVVRLFEENPLLGLLTPYQGPDVWSKKIGKSEDGSFERSVREMHGALGLGTPLEARGDQFFRIAEGFWFRTKALRSLLARDWEEYGKSRKNGQKTAGDRALLQIIPYAAQDAGFYSGYLAGTDSVLAELNHSMLCIDWLRQNNRELRESTSWKITAPIRKLNDLRMHR